MNIIVLFANNIILFEKEENKTINFLDILIKNENNQLKTTIFKKPSSNDRYLDYNSDSPLAHKITTAITLIKRALIYPIDEEEKVKQIFNVIKILTDNYPKWFIFKYINMTQVKLINKNNTPKENLRKPILILPFTDTSRKIYKIMKKHFNIAYKVKCKGNCIYTNLKEKICLENKSNVIYQITCDKCDKKYIGLLGGHHK